MALFSKKISHRKMLKMSVFTFCLILFCFLYYKCANHTNLLKKVGVPLQRNVSAFYKEYKRFPTPKETVQLIEKEGCINSRKVDFIEHENEDADVYKSVSVYECNYALLLIQYYVSTEDFSVKYGGHRYDYKFGIEIGNTRCWLNYSEGGALIGRFGCTQRACIFKNWSA